MTTVIALTAGDPAGIGPEIAVMARRALGNDLPFVVLGDPRHFAPAAKANDLPITEIASAADAVDAPGLAILPLPFARDARPGKPDHANAQGTIDSIVQSVELVRNGQAAAVCTLPISKQVLVEGAGFHHPGHTEFLAELGGVERSVMLLRSPELSVVPVTIHIALSAVPQVLAADLIVDTIRITHAALIRDFGLDQPHIAVAGLNPHAGEGGLMGHEEEQIIRPALDTLRAEGLSIEGPLPGDTMFHAAARRRYDVAVTMYHDQGLIPLKAIDFAQGVNVTLGLPFIRTSPDHGTAFALAGTGQADPTSLIEALKTARAMARSRAEHDSRY